VKDRDVSRWESGRSRPTPTQFAGLLRALNPDADTAERMRSAYLASPADDIDD
jgi:transcriptional regulator with XRE-family HTH domain